MTDEMMSLRGLLEKSADADVLREMIGFAAERLMEMEVSALTGAGFGEKSGERRRRRRLRAVLALGADRRGFDRAQQLGDSARPGAVDDDARSRPPPRRAAGYAASPRGQSVGLVPRSRGSMSAVRRSASASSTPPPRLRVHGTGSPRRRLRGPRHRRRPCCRRRAMRRPRG